MQRIFLSAITFFVLALYTSAVPIVKRVTHDGQGTWFYPGLGACGYTDTESDFVVALSMERYGDGGNCNQWLHITNSDTGASVWGLTRDACEGCNLYDVDMSPAVFQVIAPLSEGRISINWHFEEMGFNPPPQ